MKQTFQALISFVIGLVIGLGVYHFFFNKDVGFGLQARQALPTIIIKSPTITYAEYVGPSSPVDTIHDSIYLFEYLFPGWEDTNSVYKDFFVRRQAIDTFVLNEGITTVELTTFTHMNKNVKNEFKYWNNSPIFTTQYSRSIGLGFTTGLNRNEPTLGLQANYINKQFTYTLSVDPFVRDYRIGVNYNFWLR